MEQNPIFDMLKMKMLMGIGQSQPMLTETFVFMGLMLISSQQMYIIKFIQKMIQYVIPTKHSVTLEGKQILRITSWSCTNKHLFGVHMNAFWEYLKQHKFEDIYKVDELLPNYYDREDSCDTQVVTVNNPFSFIACQPTSFKVDEHIYCNVLNLRDTDEPPSTGGFDSSKIQIKTVCIELYSYRVSVNHIIAFIERVTKQYTDNIENEKKGKLFMHSLMNTQSDEKNWYTAEFNSTKRFDNMYFEGKTNLIAKIDHFQGGSEWYEKEGLSYTLGIGLHGAPGTGKTSIIKCIANKLQRHIVSIPLNKINNEEDFFKIFFETQYSDETNKVGFKDKIIVFEDIDCMSDIVNKRDASKTDDEADPDVLHHLNTVLKSSKDVSAESSKYLKDYLKTTGNKKITLSFILNLIDGLHETYGRVLIITSNYFDKLDDAIKRPGRIDITLEMKNVTKNTINEMCKHYYGRHIPMKTMGAIIDYRLSPAEVINIRINSRNFTEFIRNLVKRM